MGKSRATNLEVIKVCGEGRFAIWYENNKLTSRELDEKQSTEVMKCMKSNNNKVGIDHPDFQRMTSLCGYTQLNSKAVPAIGSNQRLDLFRRTVLDQISQRRFNIGNNDTNNNCQP